MKIFCLSDNTDTRTGLRLAGVDGAIVHTESEFKEGLEQALADKDIGILLITEKLARRFSEAVDEVRLMRTLPLVVEIPDRHGTGRRDDFITAYVHEAIGLKI